MTNFYEIISYIGAFMIIGLVLYFLVIVDKDEHFEKYEYLIKSKNR